MEDRGTSEGIEKIYALNSTTTRPVHVLTHAMMPISLETSTGSVTRKC